MCGGIFFPVRNMQKSLLKLLQLCCNIGNQSPALENLDS